MADSRAIIIRKIAQLGIMGRGSLNGNPREYLDDLLGRAIRYEKELTSEDSHSVGEIAKFRNAVNKLDLRKRSDQQLVIQGFGTLFQKHHDGCKVCDTFGGADVDLREMWNAKKGVHKKVARKESGEKVSWFNF